MKQSDRESRTRWIKLTAFFGVLAVLCVIGIFLPRPTESEIEKRKLTEFPAFTWESFWSGKWFSGIDTWYADTYPLRELLIGGNKVVQSLYGIRSDVIVGGENQGEEIPDIEGGQGELPTLPKDDPENKTDDPQQDKGDPVVILLDAIRKLGPQHPADEGHQRLKAAEVQAHRQGMTPFDLRHGQPLTNRHGEGIHGQSHTDQEQFDKSHIKLAP